MESRASWSSLGPWFLERFPPISYTLLVGCFWGSATLVATRLGGGGHAAPLAAIVTWLVFLHLRAFDELKDHAADRVAWPDRVLSRGLVTIDMIRVVGLAAVVLETTLALFVGFTAFVAWSAAYGWTLLTRWEFWIGPWLRRRPVIYAIVHNPVVAGLALFAWASTGAPWVAEGGWLLGLVSLGSLAFEVGRKTRLPDEERPGQDTYTGQLGQVRARILLGAALAGTGLCQGALAIALGHGWPVAIAAGVLVAAPGFATIRSRAKRVELGASATLLLSLVASGALALAGS